jgi:hypothetical protein
MNRFVYLILALLLFASPPNAFSQTAGRVVDIPTRPGVTQRFLYVTPEKPQASVILFAGGHGGLEISQDGSFGWGKGNFLVRSRQLFVEKNLAIAVVDAPSDRRRLALTGGFRQKPEHAADIRAVIAWLRKQNTIPVWLVGTSRGTQSAAYIATELGPKVGGPDGLVLTSTILSDRKERSVLQMPLEKITIPVLAVHHEHDGCSHCSYSDIPLLMKKLVGSPRKELFTARGGESRGDPCGAFAHHGYNGIEKEVVTKIADWIVGK